MVVVSSLLVLQGRGTNLFITGSEWIKSLERRGGGQLARVYYTPRLLGLRWTRLAGPAKKKKNSRGGIILIPHKTGKLHARRFRARRLDFRILFFFFFSAQSAPHETVADGKYHSGARFMYRFHLEPFSRPPPTQDPREHRVALVSHPVLSRDAPPILPIFAIVMPSKKKKCEM